MHLGNPPCSDSQRSAPRGASNEKALNCTLDIKASGWNKVVLQARYLREPKLVEGGWIAGRDDQADGCSDEECSVLISSRVAQRECGGGRKAHEGMTNGQCAQREEKQERGNCAP